MSRAIATMTSAARQTTTGAAFVTAANMQFTNAAGVAYYIFYGFDLDNNTAGVEQGRARIRHLTDSSTLGVYSFSPKEPTAPIDTRGFAGFYRWPGTSVSTLQSFDIEFEGSGSNTVGIANMGMAAISEETTDAFFQSVTTVTYNQTTNTVMSSLAFTPVSSGTHFVFVHGRTQGGGAVGYTMGVVATATTFGTAGTQGQNSPDAYSYFAVASHTFGAGALNAETIQLQARSSAGTGVTFDHLRIAVMRKDTFATSFYSNVKARSTGTNIAVSAYSSIVFTPDAKPHLMLGSYSMDDSSTTVSVKGNASRGATAVLIAGSTIEGKVASLAENFGFVNADTYSAASTTVRLRMGVEASTATVGMSEGRVVVLSLATVAGDQIISPPLLTAKVETQVPTVVAGKNIAAPSLALLAQTQVPKMSVEALPNALALKMAALAPFLTVDVNPPKLSLAAVLQVPTVTTVVAGAVTAVDIAAPNGTFLLTMFAPAVAGGANITPPQTVITMVGQSPTVAAGSNITPPAGALLLNALTPAVAAGFNAAPNQLTAVLQLQTPIIAAGSNITPPQLIAVMNGFAPTILSNVDLPVNNAGIMVMNGFAPTIPADQIISPSLLSLIMNGLAPSEVSPFGHASISLRDGLSNTKGVTFADIIPTIGKDEITLN